jgi:uncharacterized protein with HEPN domain
LEKIKGEVSFLSAYSKPLDFKTFNDSEVHKRVVVMTLINIGELVNALSGEIIDANPHIPWRVICDTRNKVAHHYIELNFKTIWQTIVDDIPLLAKQLGEL